MATGPAKAMREKRETTVIEHMESENRHQFDITLGTFDHPRYELIALHHADDAVIVEAMLYGTHLGPFRGLPPTGREFEMRRCSTIP
jgi:SnoaL-like polyketide cyclase